MKKIRALVEVLTSILVEGVHPGRLVRKPGEGVHAGVIDLVVRGFDLGLYAKRCKGHPAELRAGWSVDWANRIFVAFHADLVRTGHDHKASNIHG